MVAAVNAHVCSWWGCGYDMLAYAFAYKHAYKHKNKMYATNLNSFKYVYS